MSEPAGTGAVDKVLGVYLGEAADGPDRVAVARPAPAGLERGLLTRTRLVLAGLLLPLAATGLAIAGLVVPVRDGITGTAWVTATLIAVWSVCCVAAALAPERTPLWPQAAGAALGAVAFATDRLSARFAVEASRHATVRGLSPATAHHLAVAVGMVAAGLMVAVSVHLMLSLPDGRLRSRGRRVCAAAAYGIALAIGGALGAAGQEVPAWLAVAIWSVALLVVFPAARLRYEGASSRDRERMRWAAIGGAAGCGLALAVTVLSLLIGWPAPTGPVAEAFMVCFPLGLAAGNVPRLGGYGGRLLVQVLAVAGFAATVSVIYLVVILGLGRPPSDNADQRLLGLSMVAAAVAAISFAPARERLIDWANRQVFGARQAPDEVLRTFGSRMTRAIAMDELLLQLAESLRKTMTLTSAEVYTGLGDVLERTAAVPDTGARSLIIGERERPVIARAGVSGHAWASVWLPALLEAGGGAGGAVGGGAVGGGGAASATLTSAAMLLRVAPVSHAGELLGLIVVRRPAGADPFSAEDDRVLTELARQVGLALHNARLDTALATTLDELRKQAEELRASRARIVASADAERRRVERDLHDGAQQHLVALAVNLRLTRELVAEDAETAVAMIDQLADEVKATIQELRDLAHGIYPPLLADSGLAEALRAAGRRSPLPVTVSAAGIGRYDLDVETALYFCCLEALQNAAKHAAGASVEVRLWEESGGLLFSVTDDGPGFDPAPSRDGHGYTNMADRLGSIGGTVRWDSVPGRGTTISGSVPLL
ncbi:MAG TPA: GAF domain-containing sensor histidine kinase [Trebonia sp.]|nr:GAF domain-containing sensor histidine kinase [Trebonia sp.]